MTNNDLCKVTIEKAAKLSTDHILLSNTMQKDIKKCGTYQLFIDILKAWSDLTHHTPNNREDVMNQYLWGNFTHMCTKYTNVSVAKCYAKCTIL